MFPRFHPGGGLRGHGGTSGPTHVAQTRTSSLQASPQRWPLTSSRPASVFKARQSRDQPHRRPRICGNVGKEASDTT